jgi:hypothetical protein
MATTAVMSNVFQIYVTLDGAATHTVANPGRAYKITSIRAYNAGGTPNITVTDGSANVAAAQATATNAWKDLTLTTANIAISAAEPLVITNANASTTLVIVEGIASAGYDLGVS